MSIAEALSADEEDEEDKDDREDNEDNEAMSEILFTRLLTTKLPKE